VECFRTASAVLVSENCDDVAMTLSGVVAKGVLPRQSITQVNIKMCASLEGRKFGAAWIYEFVGVDSYAFVAYLPYSKIETIAREGSCLLVHSVAL
jgi:hypothetical protein